MKTGTHAGVLAFGALILGACAASSFQGPQVRGPAPRTAFEQRGAADEPLALRAAQSRREDSPLAQACKTGRSKACNEIGDRLALKHAHAEARHWYEISCERVRNAMEPTAARLLQLGQELKQFDSPRNDGDYGTAAAQKRTETLKSDASEIRARLRGCLGAGEAMNVEGEPKLALTYYDAVCEFSVLVEAAGEALLDLESMTENGCAASQAGRADPPGQTPFSPRLLAHLVQPQRQPIAAKQSAAQPEQGMVFSEDDL